MSESEVRTHLRTVTEAASGRLDAIAEGVAAAYQAESWEQSSDHARSEHVLKAAAGRVLELAFRCLAEGRRPADLEVLAVGAVTPVVSEVDQRPGALLRFLRICSRTAQRQAMAEAASLHLPPPDAIALVREITNGILAFSSQIGAAVFEAQLESARTRAHATGGAPDLFGELLGGAPTVNAQRLRHSGITLGEVNVTCVLRTVRTSDRSLEPNLDELTKWLRTTTAQPAYQAVAHARRDHVAAVIPGVDDAAEVERTITEAVAADMAADSGVRVAIGPAASGLPGVATSYQRASEVSELQRRHERLAQVLTYQSALPYLILDAAPGPALTAFQTFVEPLADYDSSRGTALVATLEAYIASVGNLQAVAQTLGVHRHTVYGRLERIADLTGARPDDPEQRLLFELGLHAMRMIGH